MLEGLKRWFGIGFAPMPAPPTLADRVKREVARIMRRPAELIRDDTRLGRHAEETCVVLTFSLGRTVSTSPAMTVGELIAQFKEE